MTQQKRLGLVLGLNLLMITGLVIVGLSSNSLGVLAAAANYAADSTAILLGIIAIQVAKNSHQHRKVTTYMAFINAAALLIVTAIVISVGIHRLTNQTQPILGLPVLIVSLIATIFMMIGAIILGKDAAKEDLHMKSVLLDTISDGASSAIVAVSGAIILITGKFYWIDPVLAIVIGLIIGYGAIKLLRDVVTSLRSKYVLNVGQKTNV
jgi:cobalt-zinc-cadmium efflux system protein